MKHYYCEGKEVFLGKPFKCRKEDDECITTTSTNCLTEAVAETLVKHGVLTVKTDTTKVPEISFADCVVYIAAKNHWSNEKALSFICKVGNTCNAAALAMINKAAAVLMDKKHEGHIASAPEIWCVSLVDWEVHPLDKETIKDYVNFAAFRSKEEAEAALKMLKNIPQ